MIGHPGRFEVYYAPPADGGVFDDVQDTVGDLEELALPDHDIVAEAVEKFMSDVHESDRYAEHNDRSQAFYRQALHEEGDSDLPDLSSIDRITFIMHDFVDHCILNPEKTAAKLQRKGTDILASDIKEAALELYDGLYDAVKDKNGLEKAFMFAIDASQCEEAAQGWREGASDRADALTASGELTLEEGDIVKAAVYKTPELASIDRAELTRVLKKAAPYMVDLKLEAISRATQEHNMKGFLVKAAEFLDLITHPSDDPAAVFRDCVEALSFLVPTLMGLGYKAPVYRRLGMALRSAALMQLFDDPNGDAERQHALAQNHYTEIRAHAIETLQTDFGGLELEVEARPKTEGSAREKFAEKRYQDVHELPDTVGLAFILSDDDMPEAEMIQFARDYRAKLAASPHFDIGHPLGEAEAYEEMLGDARRDSGYQAIHMNFFYYPDPASPDYRVPTEIQVLPQKQHRLKLYGPWSDLLYKAGRKRFRASDQAHMDHLAERALAETEMAPGTTIRSIATRVAKAPNIPSVFSKLFSAVDGNNGARVLLPPELEDLARQLPPDSLGSPDDLTVLPPTWVSYDQFLEAIDMLGQGLGENKRILGALALVDSQANILRRDRKTSVLEGHILPTASAAVMLAIQSGQIWGSKLSPLEHISNMTIIDILHDYPEDAMEAVKDRDAKLRVRQEKLFEIRQRFGRLIMAGVGALTVPVEIEDSFARREQYTRNILLNRYAVLGKPPDRLQNHIADIVRIQELDAMPKLSRTQEQERQERLDYFGKTDQHLMPLFTSRKLPPEYVRAKKIIWQLAELLGYEYEPVTA